MSAAGVSLEYFYYSQNAPKTGSILWRGNAKNLLVQLPVIFPRVHVARNIGGFNRKPLDLISMRREQRAQAAFRVEGQQFIPVNKIDQDGMAAASFVLGLDKPGASSPFVDKHFDRCRIHGRMIYQSNNQCAEADAHLFDSPANRDAHLTIRIGIDGEAEVKRS